MSTVETAFCPVAVQRRRPDFLVTSGVNALPLVPVPMCPTAQVIIRDRGYALSCVHVTSTSTHIQPVPDSTGYLPLLAPIPGGHGQDSRQTSVVVSENGLVFENQLRPSLRVPPPPHLPPPLWLS